MQTPGHASMSPTGLDHREIQALRERMNGLVFRMYRFFPFWGLLIEHCTVSIVSDVDVPTARVDRLGNIRFGARFFRELTDDQALFVLAHEIGHAAFCHVDRCGLRERNLWNVAADHAINLVLDDGFCDQRYLPPGALLDRSHAGKSAERIYADLVRGGVEVPPPVHRKASTLHDDLSGHPLAGGALIRDRRAEPRTGEKEWVQAIGLAHTRAKMQGSTTASLDRMVSRALYGEVDWLEALRRYLRFGVSCRSGPQSRLLPPNRRFVHQGLYLPSWRGNETVRVAFAVDTSGSMGDGEIGQAAAEIEEIRKQIGCEIYLIECDCEVHARWLLPDEPCPSSFRGGGGTEFIPVFDHLKAQEVPIDILVYLTDGYGDFGEDPGFDVLWITTTDVQPPYGEHIRIGHP